MDTTQPDSVTPETPDADDVDRLIAELEAADPADAVGVAERLATLLSDELDRPEAPPPTDAAETP